LFLVRHGESEFNKVYNAMGRDPGIIDPSLTETGRAQAAGAAGRLGRHKIRRVLASPYTRALQTATIIAEQLGVPLGLEPLVRERAAFTCDVGRPRDELALAWPHLDFGDLADTWWHAKGAEPEHKVSARALQFRTKAADWEDEAETVVVSHWGFILALTGRGVANCTVLHFDPSDDLIRAREIA
jgi:broad specificity phosphatase PhoE